MTDIYQELIIEAAHDHTYFKDMPQADLQVRGHNAHCGDDLQFFIKLDPATKQIQEITWQGQGCVITQAAATTLIAKINREHVTWEQLDAMHIREMEQMLGLENISPGRIKCLLLTLSTLQQVPHTK